MIRSLSRRHWIRRIELAALPILLASAGYLWTAPLRAERAFRNASLSQLVERSRRETDNPRVFHHLGTRLRLLGQDAPARAAFERAAALDPHAEDTWLSWAAAAGALGSEQEAFAVLSTFASRHPGNARARFALALFHHAEGALGRAYDEALAAAGLNPGDAAAWRLAGVEAIELRRYPEAETALRRSLALRRADWRSHLALGNALLAQRRDQEAVGSFREAARLAPAEAGPAASLGRAMLGRARNPGEIDAARELLRRAAEMDPLSGPLQLAIGQGLARKEEWREGRKRWSRRHASLPVSPRCTSS